MLLKIYPENPNDKLVNQVVECLKDGGVVILPTDTIYAICCDIRQPKAVDRMAQIKGMKKDKAVFSFVFNDFSNLSLYTKTIENNVFRELKRLLPGPFTFILEANNNIPKHFNGKKRTIGIRIPDNDLIRLIVERLGVPLACTSVKDDDDDVVEYITDPELIEEKYGDEVDIVVDGGYGDVVPSTVVSCLDGELEVLRYGKGNC